MYPANNFEVSQRRADRIGYWTGDAASSARICASELNESKSSSGDHFFLGGKELMKKTVILFLLLASLLSVGDTLAADVTLYTGYQNPGDLSFGNLDQDTQSGGVVGARFGGGGILGFEQTLGYSWKFLASGQHAFNSQSNVVVAVPAGHVAPYATAGIGFITTFGDFRGLEDIADIGTKFTINYGGGVKFKNLAGPLGFRVDVRGYSVPDVFNQTLNFVEASVGLLFSW
jgi:hypothetical protein